jgi:hypothetical protein
MLSYTDDELCDAATKLANAYPDDLTQDLGPHIITSFRSSFKTKIKQFNIVYELAFMLIVKYYVLATTFPYLCTAFSYCLHCPLLSLQYTIERPFSK